MDIYILQDQEQKGPFSLDDLKRRVEAGELIPEILAWHKDLAEWQLLRDLFQAAPPPVKPLEPPPLPKAESQPLPPNTQSLPAPRLEIGGRISTFLGIECYVRDDVREWYERVSKHVPLRAIGLIFAAVWVLAALLVSSLPPDSSTVVSGRSADMQSRRYANQEAMEEAIADEAVAVARKVYGHVMGAEAAQYSEDAGGKFPLVVYIAPSYLTNYRRIISLDDKQHFVYDKFRDFMSRVKESNVFTPVKEVFLAFGVEEFYDVYHVLGEPVPKGVIEFMVPMATIRRTNWENQSNNDIEQIIKQHGHIKMY